MNATFFEIYFKDPFLAYAYLASIPFFVAIYQAFKVLGYAGRNQVISLAAVNTLRTIKFCAISLIGFVSIGLLIMISNSDDRAGGVAMGILIIVGSIVVASVAAMSERILQKALIHVSDP